MAGFIYPKAFNLFKPYGVVVRLYERFIAGMVHQILNLKHYIYIYVYSTL